jgi:hypothetical protein
MASSSAAVIIHPQVNSVRAIADPDRPLEQELASRDLEQHRHTGSPASRSAGSSNCSALSGWSRAAGPQQGGPKVPAKAGRSALGRRWSRTEDRRTREFGRLREALSQR